MECDHDAVCEKIINEIDAVFHKDPDLCDFEIIHVASNQNKNKTPVLHVENNLGLESWCIHHTYEYAHKTILLRKLSSGGGGGGGGSGKHNNSTCNNNNIVKYLNFAILINPDVTTFWNVRRQLFAKNKLNITKEFQFSSIVLSKKPKSNEAFAYRRWLFSFQSGESIDWTFELGLCERCAEKNASNYHAWCHRQWVLQKAPYLLKYEIRITERFIRNHIGDYSAYSHRQHVLGKLLETNYYDDTNDEYTALKDYLNDHCTNNDTKQNQKITSIDDIIHCIWPNIQKTNIPNILTNNNDMKSLLYVLNIAVYDLDMCAGLTEMFDYRESIDCHRKAVLKLFVDHIRLYDYRRRIKTEDRTDAEEMTNNSNHHNNCCDAAVYQPQEKILKVVNCGSAGDSDHCVLPVLECIRMAEYKFGNNHRKWCEIFLSFDYSDINDDDSDNAGTRKMLMA